MIIQINTDKTITFDKRQHHFFTSQIAYEMSLFTSHISRIEAHLSDENGNKEGFENIRCLLEARLDGRQPIAISSQEESVEKAISSALQKLSAALTTIIGKTQNHKKLQTST